MLICGLDGILTLFRLFEEDSLKCLSFGEA